MSTLESGRSGPPEYTDYSFVEFVNEKLWLLTEQPEGWRERVDRLESEYAENSP